MNDDQNTDKQAIEDANSLPTTPKGAETLEENATPVEPSSIESTLDDEADEADLLPEPEVAEEATSETKSQEEEIAEPEIAETSEEEVKTEEEATKKADETEKETEEVVAEDKRIGAIANVSDELSSLGKWYVVHTYAGHENKVLTTLAQRVESEHLENKIFDILVPTQDKIEIKAGKKAQVKEKIFPGYILVKMVLDDASWLAVRTTPGVTSFVGIGNKPTPISEKEVASIVKFMTQGAPATFKDVFLPNDTVKIVDGPFSEFIGKVDSVDKERGKVRVLVSIFGRETPVELDFLQIQKL